MIKKMTILLIAALLAIGAAGCKSEELADIYDENEVIALSEEIARKAVERDMSFYEDYMNDYMKARITEVYIRDAIDENDKTEGAIEKIKSAVVGSSDDKGSYATCVTVVHCENGKATFTLSFDEDMKLAGFYIK